MTYLNFLILFVILPTCGLALLFRRCLTRRWWGHIALLAAMAVIWTTPWDNFIVSRQVWWYDPKLVVGIVIGYVPIEEYSFFVLQTALTGVLLAGLVGWGRQPVPGLRPLPLYVRLLPLMPLLLVVGYILASGQPRWNYLLLLLGWLAFIPLAAQWGFGLDILLQRRRAWILGVVIPTVWLTVMDAIALSAGTWTINPAQTVGVYLLGIVPVEEALFFSITNLLIVQGILLAAAPESWERLAAWRLRLTRLPQSEFSRE
jgi:lycopene cyclase domain-containing protein